MMKNPPQWVSWRERRGVRARHLIFHPMRWDCGFDTGATPLMLRDRKFLRRSCVPWFRIEMHEVPLVLVPLVLVLCGLLLVKLQLLTLSRIHNDSTDPMRTGFSSLSSPAAPWRPAPKPTKRERRTVLWEEPHCDRWSTSKTVLVCAFM